MTMTTLVTVVTPCYNSAATLEATIQSVLGQTYADIEYIIMDGASRDNTAAVVEKYRGRLTFISEPDSGQSNAINKGWRRARGQVLAWLNADDQYLPDTIETAVRYLDAHPEAMWLYGSARSIDENGKPFPYRNYRDDWDYRSLVELGCFINQPAVFLRREIVEEFGYIDESLHYGMDYEYWLRIGRKYPAHYVPAVSVQVIRASTTKTESGGVPRLREYEAITRQYGATDLPTGLHHEWGWVYAEELFQRVRRGEWRVAAGDFRHIWRYPSTLPRSFVKLFIRKFVPRHVETRLRQLLIRRY
ncbi:MAG: glycosyltransferase [Anaerolineae bacterium]|nr:glycosyltransferase [Anaerolineae bacterium]